MDLISMAPLQFAGIGLIDVGLGKGLEWAGRVCRAGRCAGGTAAVAQRHGGGEQLAERSEARNGPVLSAPSRACSLPATAQKITASAITRKQASRLRSCW